MMKMAEKSRIPKNGHDKLNLGEELFGKRDNDGFKIGLAKLQAVHVGTDDLELLRLLGAHQAVNGSLNKCRRSLTTRIH